MNYCEWCSKEIVSSKRFCSPRCIAKWRHFQGWEGPFCKGENNVAKRPEIRQKIRNSKLGKGRPDMVGNKICLGKKAWNRGLSKEDSTILFEYGRKHSIFMKNKYKNGYKTWNDGLTKESDERVRRVSENEERRRKISLAGISRSKETTEKRRTSLARYWNSLRELGILPPKKYENFTFDLKEYIRGKYGRRCFNCGTPESECFQKLSVHHKDGDKRNYDENNLIPLCRKCHGLKNKELWHKVKMISEIQKREGGER